MTPFRPSLHAKLPATPKQHAGNMADLSDATPCVGAAPQGRHLVAKRELPAGAVVCNAAAAYAVGLRESCISRVCAHCFSVVPQAENAATLQIRCEGCKQAYYCSPHCRDAHAAKSHRALCPGLERLGALQAEGCSLVKPRLILEALAKGDPEFNALSYHVPAVSPGSNLQTAYQLHLQPSVGALLSTLCSPWSLLNARIRAERIDALAASELARWCSHLRDAVERMNVVASATGSACGGRLQHAPDDETLIALARRIDANAFEWVGESGEPYGVCIYLRGAQLFNHSCAPTCEVVHQMPRLLVRTVEAVDEGEPLTIAYVDGSLKREERRASLNSRYGFECLCERCTDEAEDEVEEAADARRTAREGRTWFEATHSEAAILMSVLVGMGGHPWKAALVLFFYLSFAWTWLATRRGKPSADGGAAHAAGAPGDDTHLHANTTADAAHAHVD